MIYAQRQYENRVYHDIFGLSTDNEHFHFLRINYKGQVMIFEISIGRQFMLTFYQWSRLNMNYSQRQEIVETLAYIDRQASILSVLEGSSGSECSDAPKESRSQPHINHGPELSINDTDGNSTICWSVFQVDENMSWAEESDEDGYASDNDYED